MKRPRHPVTVADKYAREIISLFTVGILNEREMAVCHKRLTELIAQREKEKQR